MGEDEDYEQIKKNDNAKERNICKIKIDSSDNQTNLIEFNEKIYKKMIGKKRNKK